MNQTVHKASSSLDRGALRANTLSNNLVWLESFGCVIERNRGMIYVDHPKLSEYRAWLAVDTQPGTFSEVKTKLSQAIRGKAAPDIYLDGEVGNPRLRELLRQNGFQPVLSSIITTVTITPGGGGGSISLELAAPADLADWCAIYSEGFGRTGSLAEADLERWGRSFSCAAVRHWFFVEKGRRIGVCQNCVANEVVGLYSLTLRPSERGVQRVMSALGVLRARLVKDNRRIAYFETTQRIGRPHRRMQFRLQGFTSIREYSIYRRLG